MLTTSQASQPITSALQP